MQIVSLIQDGENGNNSADNKTKNVTYTGRQQLKLANTT